METSLDSADATLAMRPGQLLRDLDRRQNDVIAQLDDLESKLEEILRGLRVEPAPRD